MNFSKCFKSQFWKGILICIHHHEFMSIFLEPGAKGDGASGPSPRASAKDTNTDLLESLWFIRGFMLGAYRANAQWNNRRNIQLEDKIFLFIYFFCDLYIFPKVRLSVCPPPKKKQTKISPNDLDKHSKHRTKPEIKFRLVNPQELVEILLTLPCINTARPPKGSVLRFCLYRSRQRVKESYPDFWPGNAAHKANQAAQDQGEDGGREWGQGVSKERLAPLPSWRGELLGHCLPGEQRRSDLSDVPIQATADLSTCCDTSVFSEPGASVASTTDHLLENMCTKSVKVFLHAREILLLLLLLFHFREQEASMHIGLLYPLINC